MATVNIIDIFKDDFFSATSLTDAINIVPNTYGRIREMGLFRNEPVATTSIVVQREHGTLNLLPTRPRGVGGTLGAPTKRDARTFSTFHIPHDDYVYAEDVQNVLARTPAGMELEAVSSIVNGKLMAMRNKHSITLEHLRVSALRGTILDADGSTLLNLYTEFGVSQKEVDYALEDETDVKAKVRETKRYFEDNLKGETMSGIHVLASPTFMDKFFANSMVEEIYTYYDANMNPRREDLRKGWNFHGITFEEYSGSAEAINEDGTKTVRKFIPDDTAYAFPLGTQDVFTTYFAPGTFMDTVNTFGDEIYVRQAPDLELNQFVKLHSQSNPLPMVKRPDLVVKLVA